MENGMVLFSTEVCLRMYKVEVACEMCAAGKDFVDKAMCRMECLDALATAFDAFQDSDQGGKETAVTICATYMHNIADICKSCTMHTPRVMQYIREKTKHIEVEKKPKEKGGDVIPIGFKKT